MNYLLYKKEFPVFCSYFFQWLKKYEDFGYFNNFELLLHNFINTYVGDYRYGDIDPKNLKNEKYLEIFKENYKEYLTTTWNVSSPKNITIENIQVDLYNKRNLFEFLTVLELILKIDQND